MLSMQHNDSAVDLRDTEESAWSSMVHGSGTEDTDEDETITIHDSIHGHVTIHPLLKAIIDTPEFDRYNIPPSNRLQVGLTPVEL